MLSGFRRGACYTAAMAEIAAPPSDSDLLRRYAADRSETAFGELVRRRIDLVYSVALRQCGGDAHLAQDVVQRVFTDLARKAHRLADRPVLSGWLCRSAQFAASDLVRGERRRRVREQESQSMHETNAPHPAHDWENLRPTIDQALNELPESDRDAVALRFLEGRSFGEVGVALRLTDEAARKRVQRALDKLHGVLTRRGITSTTAALGLALAQQGGVAAPGGLAASVASAALAGGAAGSGVWAVFFTMSKIKIGIVGAAVAALIATGVGELRANRALHTEVAALQSAQAALGALRAEDARLSASLAAAANTHPEAGELVRLREQFAQLQARPPWVVESKMRSVATAQNAGWSTDTAAIETLAWAEAAGDWKTLAENFAWIGEAKTKADAAFARLSEVVRAKYGSADRLAGSVIFGSDNSRLIDYKWTKSGELETAALPEGDRVAGYWADSDPEARRARPGTFLRVRAWARLASGRERSMTTDLCYAGGNWTLGSSVFSEELWQKLTAQIDPVTGALRSGKN